MDMCFEDVGDRDFLLAHQFYVLVDVGCGIKNGGNTLAIISKEIGEFGDSIRFNTFEDE